MCIFIVLYFICLECYFYLFKTPKESAKEFKKYIFFKKKSLKLKTPLAILQVKDTNNCFFFPIQNFTNLFFPSEISFKNQFTTEPLRHSEGSRLGLRVASRAAEAEGRIQRRRKRCPIKQIQGDSSRHQGKVIIKHLRPSRL